MPPFSQTSWLQGNEGKELKINYQINCKSTGRCAETNFKFFFKEISWQKLRKKDDELKLADANDGADNKLKMSQKWST